MSERSFKSEGAGDPSRISSAKLWANLSLDARVLSSAQFTSTDGDQVLATWSQRDVVTSQRRFMSNGYIFQSSGNFRSTPTVDVKDSSPMFYSPTKTRYIKFTTKGSDDDGKVIVELWAYDGGLELTWEIDPTLHGSVYTDEWFGGVAWSPCERMVAYVADRGRSKPKEDQSKDQQETWVSPLQHKFHENARDPFGEAYIKKRSPTLFIADVLKGCSYALTEDPKDRKQDFFLGEPQWSPDGQLLVVTLRLSPFLEVDTNGDSDEFWPTDLGVRYCYNRRSEIFAFPAPVYNEKPSPVSPNAFILISDNAASDDFCCTSPRFDETGKNLVYISTPRKGITIQDDKVLPHNMTKVLRYSHISAKGFSSPRTLIPVPANPSSTDFPGLYLHALPRKPFVNPKTLVFSSVWGSLNKVLYLSLSLDESGYINGAPPSLPNVMNLEPQSAAFDDHLSSYSCTVLDTLHQTILISASSPSTPSGIYHVSLRSDCNVVTKLTSRTARSIQLRDTVDNMETYDLKLNTQTPQDSALRDDALDQSAELHTSSDPPDERFQVTMIGTAEKNGALVVFPHGGPHVTTVNGYSQGAMALLKAGYSVLYVNYRGSLGLGQRSLETLPGNIGTQDIYEVVQATRWAIKKFKIDPDRVSFVGGSHSGFIGAHVSLVPSLFKRVVLRNPVVNLSSMVSVTDIGDWCFCEADVRPKRGDGITLAPDESALRKMLAVSPVARVKKGGWFAKTLLQVGGSDRRVPPEQSLEWKRLVSQVYGVGAITLRWYPDSGHSIDEVPNGDDAWVHAIDFIRELLPGK